MWKNKHNYPKKFLPNYKVRVLKACIYKEPKKTKTIDLDDLSVEEIEEMIGNHKLEIKNLEILLKKKKDKLKLADQFFKKN